MSSSSSGMAACARAWCSSSRREWGDLRVAGKPPVASDSLKSGARSGDGYEEMIEPGTARRMPVGMFKPRFVAIALAVAGGLVALLLVPGGGGSKSPAAAHKGRTVGGEIN